MRIAIFNAPAGDEFNYKLLSIYLFIFKVVLYSLAQENMQY